jgi:hypothetical protein
MESPERLPRSEADSYWHEEMFTFHPVVVPEDWRRRLLRHLEDPAKCNSPFGWTFEGGKPICQEPDPDREIIEVGEKGEITLRRSVRSEARIFDPKGWKRRGVKFFAAALDAYAEAWGGLLVVLHHLELSGRISGIMGWSPLGSPECKCRTENIPFRMTFPCRTLPTSREPGMEASELKEYSVAEAKRLVRDILSLVERYDVGSRFSQGWAYSSRPSRLPQIRPRDSLIAGEAEWGIPGNRLARNTESVG